MHRFLFALLLAGCGGAPGGGDGGGGGGGADLTMGTGGIPDPGAGNSVDNNFGNVEPNDTPAHATPLGTAMGDVLVWVSGNTIGGADTTDYFVFKTSPKAGQFSLGQGGLCWNGAITNLSAKLWKVVAGAEVLPAVHEWTGNATCVKSMAGDAPTEPSTVYLLGVTAAGGAGMYSA